MKLVLLILLACGDATGETAALENPVPTWDGLTLDELVQVDVRGTTRATEIVLAEVQGLSATDRRDAARALAKLQVTCPYNRASVQLPIALHQAVSRFDETHLDPVARSDWRYLERGLAAHVAILDALGADLPLPAEGDYLHGKLYPDAPKTRAEIEQADDPVALTLPLLASIPFVVNDYDAATYEAIGVELAAVEARTAHQWPLDQHLMGWRSALTRIQPFVQGSEQYQEISYMIYAIDTYMGLSC